jgi:hypothetical protein
LHETAKYILFCHTLLLTVPLISSRLAHGDLTETTNQSPIHPSSLPHIITRHRKKFLFSRASFVSDRVLGVTTCPWRSRLQSHGSVHDTLCSTAVHFSTVVWYFDLYGTPSVHVLCGARKEIRTPSWPLVTNLKSELRQ